MKIDCCEPRQLPDFVRAGERCVAHQLREDLAEEIGLHSRQQSCDANIAPFFARAHIESVWPIELIEFQTGLCGEVPPQGFDKYLVTVSSEPDKNFVG